MGASPMRKPDGASTRRRHANGESCLNSASDGECFEKCGELQRHIIERRPDLQLPDVVGDVRRLRAVDAPLGVDAAAVKCAAVEARAASQERFDAVAEPELDLAAGGLVGDFDL